MPRPRGRATRIGTAALTAAASLAAAGCGGASREGEAVLGTAMFEDASTRVVNPSDAPGGTLKLVTSEEWDSLDPGNTYRAFAWNFARLYGRSLVAYRNAPGQAGTELVPDMATSLGKVSDDGMTVTYTLRPGVTYEDGTPVRSRDVKYAVERSNYASEVLGNGPAHFRQLLGGSYRGPYAKPPSRTGLPAITTPDDATISFHLTAPFAEFDHLAALPQTIPVPAAKDTGADYGKHPLSTGPYKIDSYDPGKFVRLVANPEWKPEADPLRRRLAESIEVTMKLEPNDLDDRLLAGAADLDMAGTGLAAAGRARVQSNPSLRKNVDNPLTGWTSFVALNTTAAPLTDVHCRRAVLLAADHEALHAAYGGSPSGDLATTLLPPTVSGHRGADRYGFLAARTGDVAAAKEELKACGKPDGFRTGLAARSDRPKEMAAVQALQVALERVGIKLDLHAVPSDRYFGDFAGSSGYVDANNLGLAFMAWSADWPSGYAFLAQLVDSQAVRDTRNSNLSRLADPEVDRLLRTGRVEPDPVARARTWGDTDARVIDSAAVLPIVHERVLSWRSPQVTNVFVHPAYGMYSLVGLGVLRQPAG
jgi:peptide/nickel transport system substrate-binding protein